MNWKTCFSALGEEWCAEHSLQSSQQAFLRAAVVSRHGQKGVVVFPSRDALGKFDPQQIFEVCESLHAKLPTLALVVDPDHLRHSPRAGGRVLVCPDYPEVALTALRSASWVASFDPYVTQLCGDLGVACYEVAGSGERGLPWFPTGAKGSKTVADQVASEWFHRLGAVGQRTAPARLPSGDPQYGVCAVADSNFIGFFFGLVENLLHVTKQPFHVFLLALDEKAKELALRQYPDLPMTVFLAGEVWPEADWKEYQHKPIAERAYASKPRAVLEGVRRMKGAPLFFADVDIHFFESPFSLSQQFKNDNILFMPQWSDVFAWARFHGMFNSGLMAVRQGAEPFLQWWADMCVPFCRVEMDKGYFTDQVFLDMGMWHFPHIGVYREMDHNVAPWNRKTLGVYRPGRASGELRLKDHRIVKSFHAAGPDSDGYFQLKFAWDQMVSFFSVLSDPDELNPLFRNTLDQQRLHWPELDAAIEVRARWSRRLKRTVPTVNTAYVQQLLVPAGKDRTRWLQRLENAARLVLQLFKRQPPQDNISREEQKTLVAIQQKFAFATIPSQAKLRSPA